MAIGFRRDTDAAENNGDAMDIGDVVEQVLRQRVVDRRKQDIAVENRSVGITFMDPTPLGSDAKGGGAGTAPESLCNHVDLEASYVVPGGVEKAV